MMMIFMLLLLTGHMPLRGEPSPGANQRISGSVNMAGMSGATGGMKYAMEYRIARLNCFVLIGLLHILFLMSS